MFGYFLASGEEVGSHGLGRALSAYGATFLFCYVSYESDDGTFRCKTLRLVI
jgi:hypothetical protein